MKKLFTIILVAVAMMGCENKSLSHRIQELEKKAYSSVSALNPELGEELVSCYCSYAEQNPDDAQAPDYLFKALDVSLNLSNPARSLDIANTLLRQYPNYEMTPMALFIKGFIYEDRYHDNEMARQAYQSYIDNYPDGELVDDAKASIENLGVSIEDLVKKFEAENDCQKPF